MKRGADSSALMAGFTIVETMIVLAVTGVLFASIATTWFGRQHKTEFQTSAQEIRSKIQQVISEVQNGYFPNQNNFSCSGSSPSLQFSSDASTAKEQGTNYPCVFLGKVIQFHIGNAQPEEYRVYTVAADGSKTQLSDAEATVIAPDGGIDLPDNSTSGTLHSGLSLQAYKVDPAQAVKFSQTASKSIALGFLSSLGSLDGNGAYTNGTQQVNFYPLTEDTFPSDSAAAAHALNGLLSSNLSTTANSQTQLCFQSGSTNQFAVITIGANNSTLTADLQVKQGTCDADFS